MVRIEMENENFREELERCRDYGDLFEIVKKLVKKKLGRERAGLMLYLGNLPLHIGAFHGVGSNGIVINKRLLNAISFDSTVEVNSYIFTLLLHEYLHSLGYMNERQVRRLVYELCRETFGEKHPATRFALSIPKSKLILSKPHIDGENTELEIIKDFERSHLSYIS